MEIKQTTKELDGDKLRYVAGAFATGIAVVSLMDEQKEVIGMTINSFLSVSLEPPILLFSVDKESRMLPYCTRETALSINILSENQKHISDHYAGLLTNKAPLVLDQEKEFIRVPEATAWYQTRIRQTIEAGDHHLVLCDILDCDRDPNMEPLVFYKGYRTVGSSVES